MEFFNFQPFGILLAASFVLLMIRTVRRTKLPPGPSGLPLLGNILGLPTEYEWEYWAKFKDLYGPISSVTILGKALIILNDLETCTELLEKRSSKYSGRPVLPFAGEIIGWNRQMILSQYNDHFRGVRKFVTRYIGTRSAITPFQPVQEMQARLFLARVLEKKRSLLENIRLTQGSTFLRLSHGYNVDPSRPDPLVQVIENAAQEFYIATRPGAWMVDTFPFLRHVPDWFPFTGWKRVARKFRETNEDQSNRPHLFVKQQLAGNTAVPSFTSTMLESNPTEKEEGEIKFAAGSLYGGGTDTVTATIGTFFLAMLLYPEAQKKAQAELDTVVGRDRLPSYNDRNNLPYIEAIIKEVERWHTVGPMGIPHCTTEDDIYNGYFIPKGSLVMANIWKISQDEYSDPDRFKPERFLGEKPELDPHMFAFGFGRRGCPGIQLADANVYITIAMSLAVFNILPRQDPITGERRPPKPEFISGTVCHPKPFECDIQPRSETALRLIRSIYDEEQPKPSAAPAASGSIDELYKEAWMR